MSNLNSLLESSNQWKSVQSDAAKLGKKWEKTGLLEGIGNETEKNNMSMILENQAKQLVVESSQTGGGTAGASFSAGTGEQWAGIALPLVRKVFGQIAAKDFVSVQPMNLPSGLVFFLDFQYGGGKAIDSGKFPTGGDVFGSGSLYGVTDTSTAPTDGLYGAGKWTYSTNVTSSTAPTTTITSASWAETGYDSDLSGSATGAASTLKKLEIALTEFNEPDVDGVRGFFVEGTDVVSNTAQYNYADDTNVYLFVNGVAADPTNLVVNYVQQPTDNKRGDFEDGNNNLNGEDTPIDIPEINIKMMSEAIVAKTKKLKTDKHHG